MENIKIPVEKNKDYEMNIESLGAGGEGVGRIQGFAVFVEGALPGERILVKIVKVTKSYAYGKLLHIIQKSPDRVEPQCPYFKGCGGCQLQHLSYEGQLKYKTRLVKDALERIGHLDNVKILPAIGMDEPWRYRNKAQFPVGLIKGKLAIGLYAARSHNLIDINDCPIQHGINEKVIHLVHRFIQTYNIPVYDESVHKGIIRHVVIKVGFKSNQLMVIIVTNGELPRKKELVSILREGLPSITSIIQNYQTERTNVILGNKNVTLWGSDYIMDAIGDLKFKISPLSFFQVNPVQTEKLYAKALEYAALTGKETVIDAYCGIGTISLFLARKAAKVYGVEVVPQAIEDAKENARINGITNAEFLTGESEVIIPRLSRLGVKADVVVVDPPRKGCDEKLLDTIAEMAPERMVYVSCNPATLARDLMYMVEKGYQVNEVQPVDMFPQGYHVECVIGMQRKDT
ncbi:MAG TPA: 23S rRNA (uracil(1939)-C(5))-methyltransferase RlmD [Clostridiales bacterium]|nr:23S rRNA (uracil(1939)-C(5))-methyltransferase RlmD [Clostridiales bacterium]